MKISRIQKSEGETESEREGTLLLISLGLFLGLIISLVDPIEERETRIQNLIQTILD